MFLVNSLIFLVLGTLKQIGSGPASDLLTVTVVGQVEMTASPKIVRLNWSFNKEGKTAFNAMSSMKGKSSQLLDKLKNFGLEEKDFMPTNISLFQVYKNNDYQCQEI